MHRPSLQHTNPTDYKNLGGKGIGIETDEFLSAGGSGVLAWIPHVALELPV